MLPRRGMFYTWKMRTSDTQTNVIASRKTNHHFSKGVTRAWKLRVTKSFKIFVVCAEGRREKSLFSIGIFRHKFWTKCILLPRHVEWGCVSRSVLRQYVFCRWTDLGYSGEQYHQRLKSTKSNTAARQQVANLWTRPFYHLCMRGRGEPSSGRTFELCSIICENVILAGMFSSVSF